MRKPILEKVAVAASIIICLSFVACATTPQVKSMKKPEVKAETIKAAIKHLEEKKRIVDCSSAKEYITTVNYLRASRGFGLGEPGIKTMANKIAGGCTGAAERFIKVSELLFRAKLDGRSTAKVASDVAIADKKEAETFMFVFKKAFLSKYLDLDLTNSVKIAKKMSLEFKGNQEIAEKDFAKITEFCVESKYLDLPKAKCAHIAVRIVKYGENFDIGVAESFIDAVEVLRLNSKGPKLATFNAIKIAEEIVKISPYALKNFVNAYRFAVAKSGHKMDRKSAITFARAIAAKTVKKLH